MSLVMSKVVISKIFISIAIVSASNWFFYQLSYHHWPALENVKNCLKYALKKFQIQPTKFWLLNQNNSKQQTIRFDAVQS